MKFTQIIQSTSLPSQRVHCYSHYAISHRFPRRASTARVRASAHDVYLTATLRWTEIDNTVIRNVTYSMHMLSSAAAAAVTRARSARLASAKKQT
jgi:hypothetical protein